MRKRIAVYSLGALCLLFSSCAQEFNQVYKSQDYNYKYEYAKECFARGKYSRATTLLQDLIIQMKGHKAEQESLYMLAMSEYCDMDYTTASEAFKKYVKSYPYGIRSFQEIREKLSARHLCRASDLLHRPEPVYVDP